MVFKNEIKEGMSEINQLFPPRMIPPTLSIKSSTPSQGFNDKNAYRLEAKPPWLNF